MYFDEFDFEPALLDAIDSMNFTECTPIQENAIPPILEGHDLLGIAQTGTGKTAAYLLPILNQISLEENPSNSVKCVIMVPTRELAQQIDHQIDGFSYFLSISGLAVYGGNDGIRFEQERRSFSMGADIVVATPGRLISHLSLGNADLSQVKYFVLDEADRMLDMGFCDDIMQIVKALPQERQNLLFSATMPDEIQKLAAKILVNPVEIKLAVSKPADKILQAAYVCYEAQKQKIIQSLFAESQPKRVIVFSSSKLKVKEITKSLQKLGLNVGEMHSDLEQAERNKIMHLFRNGHVNILVATDIVARGIDIDDIDLVINYDVPSDAEDYVHRVGRTARANADGCALTLISVDDQSAFMRIERFLDQTIYKIPLTPEMGEGPAYTGHKSGLKRDRHKGGHGRSGGTPKQEAKAGGTPQEHKGNGKRGKRKPFFKRRKPGSDGNSPA